LIIYFLPIIIIIVDQLSKLYVLNNIPLNTYVEVFSDILFFQHIQNDGIAFGISLGNFQGVVLAITLIIIGVVVYLLSLSVKNNSTDKYPLAFIVGGAIGNAIDRILVYFLDSYNGVIDFIYIGINENIRYPWVFNVADIAITIGLILFFIFEISKYINEQKYSRNQ